MDLNLSWGELARACGGKLIRGESQGPVSSISTDTRRLAENQIFWALIGERTDGHLYLEAAKKCAGWVVQKDHSIPGDGPKAVLEVPDTQKALQALAAFHRKRFDIPIAAVAGSNGKTSTKEMLHSICSQEGAVCATTGNLNNQFGLPLSILELNSAHRYGVFELGESHPGDIEELTRIAQPTVGVLTNVGPAHLEFLGNLEGVFKTMTEMVSAISPESRIAINLDDPWLANLEIHLGARAITYGRNERAAVRLIEEQDGMITLVIQRHRISIALPTPIKIHHINAAAAAAGAVGMGISPNAIAEGLKQFKPPPLRFEVRNHPSGAVIIADVYNANPGSMKAGIESFCEAYPKSKRVLVLGDMKELGTDSPQLHREMGEWVAAQTVDSVFLAGRDMAEAADAIMKKSKHPDVAYGSDYSVWIDKLRPQLGSQTAVYFKASRAMAFEKLLEAL